MVSKNYYKLAYYNFVKQSKAKPLLYLLINKYLLINNFKFYISQFFKTFNFLSVCFGFAKTLSLRVKRSNLYKLDCHDFLQSLAMTTKNNFANINNKVAFASASLWEAPCVLFHELLTQGVKTALLYNFLTLIKFNFDSLSRKIKNPCLVINILFIGGIQ